MKILQVVHSLPFYNQAGTEIFTQCLSYELSRRHEVHIFCRISEAKQKEYQLTQKTFGAIKLYFINNTFKAYDSFEQHYENEEITKRFAQLLDEVNPDVVHIQHLVFLSVSLIKKIKERGIPIVFALHDYWLMCPRWHIFKKDNKPCEQAPVSGFNKECPRCLEELFNTQKGIVSLYKFGRKFLPNIVLKGLKGMYFSCINGRIHNGKCIDKLRARVARIKEYLDSVDVFLAPSEFLMRKFIKFGIPAEKIKLSKQVLDTSLFAETQKAKAAKIRFAFIGTLLPSKGAHILIEAFNGIKTTEAELKIFGKLYPYAGFEDYSSYLKKIIKNKNIRFMGDFAHDNIANIFKQIDVLIVPSLWQENSPLVIQEAFLSKTPVIASKIGGIPELINDGVNGMLFNPGDIEDLCKKIEFIIYNRDAIREFTVNFPHIKNIEDYATEIEDIYGKLISKNKVYDYLNV